MKADADILPTLKATVGMRTGGDEPVSGNQTLGSAFTTKSLGLELASIRWKPEATEIVTIEGGKTFYKYEYRLVEGLAEGRFKIAGFSIKIYGDYVQNTDPDSKNKGYMAGLTLGEAKEPWTFSLDYNYRGLEKDAVVGALTDSDSWGGGTDGKGHRISGVLQLAQNGQLGTTFFWNDAGISGIDKSYKRLQVDVGAKF